MLQGLSPFAREARPWTFEQARGVLARLLRLRLDTDAERDLAASLIEQRKFDDLVRTFPAFARPVVFEFGYDYEFVSSTEFYKSGRMDAVLRRILERFDPVQAVMLPTLGEERRATYSPFLPISPKSGRVLQAPTLERHVERGTIVFADED